MVTLEEINDYLKHERNLGPITQEDIEHTRLNIETGEKLYFSERHTTSTLLKFLLEMIK